MKRVSRKSLVISCAECRKMSSNELEHSAGTIYLGFHSFGGLMGKSDWERLSIGG